MTVVSSIIGPVVKSIICPIVGESTGGGATIPDAPSSLVATTIDTDSIRLEWVDNSDDETGFSIERSSTGVGGWVEIDTVAANATTFTDNGLADDTEYFYRVSAFNGDGSSAASNVDSATTDEVVETDFIFTVTTTGASETFTIPCQNAGTFNAVVDWGDGGATSAITAYNDGDLAHVYASAGDHQIRISGTFPNIYFNNAGDRLKVKSVENLGETGWTRLNAAFYGCTNMTSFDCGNCDTSAVTTLVQMFRGCSALASADVTGFDTGLVTTFVEMFRNALVLTGLEIHGWNIASATGMTSLLASANNAITNDEYDATLIAWEAQPHQLNVTVHFGDAKYSAGAAATARAALVSDGWTLTDGGSV